jgi:hypothetical protein
MTNPYYNFHIRLSPEAEMLRRELQKQSGESNGKLVERALRKLAARPDDASEQRPGRSQAAAA